MLFRAAVRDPKIATTFDRFATRQIGPAETFAKTVPRSLYVNARQALRRGGDGGGATADGRARAAVR
jgi:hypothetical protein